MFRYSPNRWSLQGLHNYCKQCTVMTCDNGEWRPARPSGYPSILERLSLAWAVFSGNADAVFWETKKIKEK